MVCEVAFHAGRYPSLGFLRHHCLNLLLNHLHRLHHLVDLVQVEVEGLAGVLDDHRKLEDLDHWVVVHLLNGLALVLLLSQVVLDAGNMLAEEGL